MALQASTVWEFRTDGDNGNGGGFTSGGTDYSQQAAAQLTIADGATSGIGVTTLTSATGGFTAAMVGNIVYFPSGTNLTIGWYEITAHTDTNTVTLDRAPDDGVGGVSGAAGKVGGARTLPTDEFFEQLPAGNVVWFKSGTYTLGAENAVNAANDGTITLLITIEGYNSSRGDNPTLTDQPLIAAGANTFSFDNYWRIKNIRVTTTAANGLKADVGSIFENCSVNNSSGVGGRSGFKSITGRVINCEAQSVNGTAVEIVGIRTKIISCYLHDSNIGIAVAGHDDCQLLNNVINTCITGISDEGIAGSDRQTIVGNTLYNGTTGISINDGGECTITNNIMDAFTTGASWTTEQGSNLFDYNCWDNTVDVSNVTKGDNAVTGDPGLTDPANGDFTLGSGSNCLDAGLQVGVNQGVVGNYKVNIGVDQDDVSAAGGLLVNPGMAGGFNG